VDFPSLSEPYDPQSPSEKLTAHPDVASAVKKIVAACGQIGVMVQVPFLTLCDASMGYHLPSCLRFFEASHTVEILRDAGRKGMHVEDIAAKIGCDVGKLSHILRLLATHHLLTEVTADTFAINRVSSAMDTGKSWQDILANPEKKYEGTKGVAAFVAIPSLTSLSLNFALGSPAPAPPPSVHLSNLPTHSPFNTAFRTEKEFFAWLEEKGNEGRMRRFGCAMTGSGGLNSTSAFPWHTLPEGALVVDVGGGIGSTSLLLARKFEGLRFMVQDRVGVVKMGEEAWRERAPELLDGGRVTFMAHDFFRPQPALQASPAVFLLRVIMHDWPDEYARKILLNLRRVAVDSDGVGRRKTRLVVADHVLPLACEDLREQGAEEDEGGLVERRLPSWRAPLLSNLGKASANAYWMDLTMRCMFNSQERTLREMITLLESAGWKAQKMSRAEGSLF
ncbi:O-methyltransferase, partial [Gloeophyllum trabeum ATCC 11539]